MKPFLFVVFTACVALMACSSVKKGNSSVVQQGIAGIIQEVTGNRMPMADRKTSPPKGIVTTVFVYEPTNISQVKGNAPLYTSVNTKQVAFVQTDSTGAFSITLAPGSYSVFIKKGSQFYGNLFDEKNNIAVFVVSAGKLTAVNLTVSSSAVF